MEEKEKYVAILFEKFNYDVNNGIFLFKPIDVLSDCQMNFENDILTSKTGNEYLCMDDEILSYSEENMCYGYPMLLDDLKEQYDGLKDETEILKEYLKDISGTVYFGVYDAKEKRIKSILAPKDYVKNMEDDNWFFDFEINSISEEQTVEINKKAFDELLKCIDDEDYETVRNYFANINQIFNFVNSNSDTIETNFEVEDNSIEIQETSKEKEVTTITNDLNTSLKKLDDLVGLENVKKEVNNLVKYLIFIKKVGDKVNLPKPNLNMFFTGNPGTGKTTVARIMAEILYDLGYVKKNKVAEITTKDLIAEYVGQTAVKTNKVIKQNKGGVIFIDEAYSFSSRAQEFGQEALVEIIKEMEKYETVFIFAGYKDEMKDFMEMNPGLASRTGYYIDYKDYDTMELYDIFKKKVESSCMQIGSSEVEKKILSIIEDAKKQEHFGNGRFIDKLFNKIIMEHSNNMEEVYNIDELLTIIENDISDNLIDELLYSATKKNSMGFEYPKEKVKKIGD